MSEYAIKPLGAATWDAFVNLAEKHNGVWGWWLLVHLVPSGVRREGRELRG
jgi:hypothetical protein